MFMRNLSFLCWCVIGLLLLVVVIVVLFYVIICNMFIEVLYVLQWVIYFLEVKLIIYCIVFFSCDVEVVIYCMVMMGDNKQVQQWLDDVIKQIFKLIWQLCDFICDNVDQQVLVGLLEIIVNGCVMLMWQVLWWVCYGDCEGVEKVFVDVGSLFVVGDVLEKIVFMEDQLLIKWWQDVVVQLFNYKLVLGIGVLVQVLLLGIIVVVFECQIGQCLCVEECESQVICCL